MWFLLREETGERASVLAQRAVADPPRWTRAVEAHPSVSSAVSVMDGGKRWKARNTNVKGKGEGFSLLFGCLFAFTVAGVARPYGNVCAT